MECIDVTVQPGEDNKASVVFTAKTGSHFYGSYTASNAIIRYDSEITSAEFVDGTDMPVVKCGDRVLTEGVDYELSFSGDTFTVTGINLYEGSTRTGTCPQRTLAVYTRTDRDSASVGNAAIETEEPLYAGNTVRVKASWLPGYFFMGWYAVTSVSNGLVTEYGRSCLSIDRDYEFRIEGDTQLVAVYRPNGYARVTINANGEFYVGDSQTPQTGPFVESYLVGTRLTIRAKDSNKAFQWTNESGNVLGTGDTVEITVTRQTSVALRCTVDEADVSYVQFVSDYNQVLAAKSYQSTDAISFAGAPAKYGCTFEKWVFEGTETEATEGAIKDAIGKHAVITIKPFYTMTAGDCTVRMRYLDETGETLKPETTSTIARGSSFSITGPKIDRYKLKCWEDESGAVLGYGDTYFMQVSGNASLVARYVAAGEEVESVPVIVIGEPYAVTSGSTNKVACAVTRSVPEGYSVIEHGMLYSKAGVTLNDETFVVDGDNVKAYTPASTARNGVTRLNVAVDNNDQTVWFRGYMILINEATGNQETVYSGIKHASYSDLV